MERSKLEQALVDHTKQRARQLSSQELRTMARIYESQAFGISRGDDNNEPPLYFGYIIDSSRALYDEERIQDFGKGKSVAEVRKEDENLLHLELGLFAARKFWIRYNVGTRIARDNAARELIEFTWQRARELNLPKLEEIVDEYVQNRFGRRAQQIFERRELIRKIYEHNSNTPQDGPEPPQPPQRSRFRVIK